MSVTLPLHLVDDTVALRIAREIAMNLHDLETILKNNNVSTEAWDRLQTNQYFRDLVQSAVAEWESASNTHERTKLKAASLLEQWLLEANTRLHDPKELLTAKVQLATLLKSLSGMGVTSAQDGGGGGERFSVTINLGGDAKLKFEKKVTPKVIEGELAPTQE